MKILENERARLRAIGKVGNHAQRLNPIEKARKNPKSLRMVINAKCFDCTCGQRVEITHCPVTGCSLYPVRPYQGKRDQPEAEEDKS